MTTLLIADDQALVRVGLRKILENEPQTTVVGEAGNGQDAVAAARRLRPDVVLMDIRMPVLDGIEATRRIVRAQPSTRVLILTTFGLDDYVYDALRAGASGFMLKDAPPEEIAAAVRIVASGDALLAPAVTRAVIEEFTRIPVRAQPAVPPAVGELTPREREVLDLLIRGLSNPEICRELVISEATAKTHVAKILQKLGVRDRVQAVIYAYQTGLISPSPLSGQVAAGVGETPGRERGIAAFRLPARDPTVYSGIDGAFGRTDGRGSPGRDRRLGGRPAGPWPRL
jgi:DNA-binding NarL/FixJ family response regulator